MRNQFDAWRLKAERSSSRPVSAGLWSHGQVAESRRRKMGLRGFFTTLPDGDFAPRGQLAPEAARPKTRPSRVVQNSVGSERPVAASRAFCGTQERLRNTRRFKVAFSKAVRLLKKPLLTKEEGIRYVIDVNGTVPGCVMVAQQTLDLLVGVRILPGEYRRQVPP